MFETLSSSAFLLEDYGILNVHGKDAKKFLQGQLTCDLEQHFAGQAGAHCNQKGRVIATFYIWQQSEHFYLLMPRQLIPIILAALQKYAIFSKVTLRDVSHDFAALAYIAESTIDTNDLMSMHISSNPQRHIILGEKNKITEYATELAKKFIFHPSSFWHCCNIQDEIPTLCPATSGVFLAADLNLYHQGAISFSKGCYIGQEIIARMHYKGKSKKEIQLVTLFSSYSPTPGMDIYTNDEKRVVSSIVDLCKIEYNKYMALLLKNKEDKTSTILNLDSTGKIIE